jgi:hypothetical protein
VSRRHILPVSGTGPLELVLRLLDHQLVGARGELVGNVDDLVLEERAEGLLVTGLLSGPPALARRQGGLGERWIDAIWRRLHPLQDPPVEAIVLDAVTKVDSAVHLDRAATRFLVRSDLLEAWLRENVVSRLPWVSGEPHPVWAEDTGRSNRPGQGSAFVVEPGTPTLSRLLGSLVRTAEGEEVGEVTEVLARPLADEDGRRADAGDHLGPLRVTALVCSHRHLGQELGYTMTPQGPRAIALLVRAWHKGDRHVAIEAVEAFGWDGGEVRVRAGAHLRHPHEAGPGDH